MTDVNLSGTMSGWDLARVARERDPAFPDVYMTGTACAEKDWIATVGKPMKAGFFEPSGGLLCTRIITGRDGDRGRLDAGLHNSVSTARYRLPGQSDVLERNH